jgi:hypothetical protein
LGVNSIDAWCFLVGQVLLTGDRTEMDQSVQVGIFLTFNLKDVKLQWGYMMMGVMEGNPLKW